jgi:Holliday junction resolvasome RuvABC endonuclease subunit
MGGKIRIAGLDGSKRNFGISIMDLDIETLELSVVDLVLVKTKKSNLKNVRKSSDNLLVSQQISAALREHLKGCVSAFIEVPSGGQSYEAVLSFGIVIGLYASITIPTVEVSPSETKKAALGTNTASKEEMVEWAVGKYPDAPWRRHKKHEKMVLSKDNEHLADGVGIAHAGIKLPVFQQTLAILKAHST